MGQQQAVGGQLTVGSRGRWWCEQGQFPWPALELTSLASPQEEVATEPWGSGYSSSKGLVDT